MAEVRWSLTAAEDLRGIEETVAKDSPVYAVRLTDRLVEAVERLEPFPLSGRMVPEFEREELREVLCSSYRIVHLVHGDVLTILRVVRGTRDIIPLAEQQPWDTIG